MHTADKMIKEYIDTAISRDMLSQACIFEGARGTGRMEMALYMAKALLCTDSSGNKPCLVCHACRLVDSDNHPDCVIVTHEKPQTLAVKEIRDQVVDDIAVRPYYGGRKLYIIPDAELMNASSQNALLKTIEEPPSYAHIILIVNNKERLLQTIRSRCVTLTFKAEPEFQTDDEDVKSLFSRFEAIISRQDTSDTSELFSYAKVLATEYKEYIPELLTHGEKICRDALLYKSGIYLTDDASKGYIEKTAMISYEGLEHILKAIESARHDMLINVAAEAVLDSLLMHIGHKKGEHTTWQM